MLKKSLNAIIWMGLSLLVVILVYKNTDWFKPAADKAMDSIASAVSKAPAGPFGKNSSEDMLNKGRDAFAAGDIEGSITAYKDYLKSNSNNADAHGELGNVYYLNGRYQESAQSYYDSAKLLIEQKQTDRVPALLPVIAQVNPALADELAQKMSQISAQITQQTAPGQQHPPQSATRYQ
jgi:tetratricopeptide (TPR) repeat protein